MLNLGHLFFGRCIDCGVLQNYDIFDGSIVAQVLVLVGAKMQSLQVSGELVTTMAQIEPPAETALMRAEIAYLSFNPDTKEILKILHI